MPRTWFTRIGLLLDDNETFHKDEICAIGEELAEFYCRHPSSLMENLQIHVLRNGDLQTSLLMSRTFPKALFRRLAREFGRRLYAAGCEKQTKVVHLVEIDLHGQIVIEEKAF